MPPSYMDVSTRDASSGYLTPQEYPSVNLERVDSPLEFRQATSCIQQAVPKRNTITMPPDPRPSSRQRSSSNEAEDKVKDNSLRFFTVNDPKKLKDKTEMRANRQHVMRDFLRKERQKSDSTDARAGGPSHKRRKVDPPVMPGSSANLNAPSHIFDTNRLTPASSAHSNASEQSESRSKAATSAEESLDEGYFAVTRVNKKTAALTRKQRGDGPPLVSLFSLFRGTYPISEYLIVSPEQVPFPLTRLGGKVNQFNTWPAFSQPEVDVGKLKYICSRRFGSEAIAKYWVPTLLRARHAFLSTICISAAHDEIMHRSAIPNLPVRTRESVERMAVRDEVITMINRCLGDPELCKSDATIIAVLHVLNSEIMDSDEQTLNTHQNGIERMIELRGGLGNLGLGGQLSSMLTLTMYLIAALHENIPKKAYIGHASSIPTQPPTDSRPLPESPLYTRPAGYSTIFRCLKPHSRTVVLLDAARELTIAFATNASRAASTAPPSHTNTSAPRASLLALKDRIFTFPTSSQIQNPSNEDRVYEAIALTCRLYAYALSHNVPFSKANVAPEVVNNSAPALRSGARKLSLVEGPTKSQPPAMHVQIKLALENTARDDCWGHLAGVLFWISLVAGAAANPSEACHGTGMATYEEEEARKWLAATAVRCKILLGFEHVPPILGTLRRMVDLQQALARTQTGSAQQIAAPVPRFFGPAEPPSATFGDFAWDFMKS